MSREGGHYGQVWEGNYGTRDGFIVAINQINQLTDKDAITGLTFYWSDVPYSLELYAYVAYDPEHHGTTSARQLVLNTLTTGGGRLRTDITGEDLTRAISQRQLNCLGLLPGIPFPDPCQFLTKSALAKKGFDFSPWQNRTRTFLSHQADRKSEVGILQMLLTDRNIPTWMDVHDIEFGEPIGVAIERGMSESTFVIFWISEGFLRSRWCQFEFEAFLHKYASMRSVTMLSVIEAGCETRIPPTLDRLKYLHVDSPGDPHVVARQLGPVIAKLHPPPAGAWS